MDRVRRTPPILPIRLSAPLAAPALALAAGVVADRHLAPLPTFAWLTTLAALLWGAAIAVSREATTITRPLLLAAAATLAAAWHHARWSDLAPSDLACFAWPDRGTPAWVRGVLAEEPTFFDPDPAAGALDGYTRLILRVEAISDGAAWHPASGRLLASVTGDARGPRMGDRLRLAGAIRPIEGPQNPGEADPRERWRADGVRLRMSVKSTEAIGRLDEAADPWLAALGACRRRSEQLLTAHLPSDVAPLAAALLLGRREAIDPDLNDAFARTGTTHWLAISGLHMQALALLVGWVLSRTVLGLRGAAIVVLAATVLYTLLVGAAPSVVRSAAMTVVGCLGLVLDRPTYPGNLLALAAIVLLALNPAWLFDVGAQLSFLSIAGLAWGVPSLARAVSRAAADASPRDATTPRQALDRLERLYAPPAVKAVRWALAWVAASLAGSALLWAIGLPLTLHRFHVAAFVAIALNVVLVPLSLPALASALVALLAAAFAPALAGGAAWVCGGVLRVARSLVSWGATAPFGHLFVGGPPAWWVLAFYVALTAALRPTTRRYGQCGLAACAIAALGLWLTPRAPTVLEADVLDVDHGLSVLVRAPSGRTLLYDCGRMRDPRVGSRVVAPALWRRDVRRVDVLVLSHADLDHFSGLADLLERVPVGEVRVPPGFGANGDRAALDALDACRRRRVPVRPIAAGESIDLGPGVSCRALHPSADWRPDATDNARSVVLDVNTGGRGLLLTGDLDGPGIDALLATEAPPVDVMLAPHHGGRTANPARLYAWADPKTVLVSQTAPDGDPVPELAALQRDGRALRFTGADGALRLRWSDSGIAVRGFGQGDLDPRPPLVPAALGLWGSWSLGLAALLAGLGACVAIAVVEWGAWALVAPGRRAESPLEPAPWEPIEAAAPDGARLAGALRVAEGHHHRVALLLHGFAEDRSALLGRADALAARGWTVAALDSRARGRSGGAYCTFGAIESNDLRVWIDSLARRLGAPTAFAAWGRSMGAVIALRAAADGVPLRALVLEAPYADLAQPVADTLRRTRLPALLARRMLRRAAHIARVALDRPRPIDLAPRVGLPVLILHGADDPVAPPSEVRALAAAFPMPPDRVEVPGARHADVFDAGGAALADRVAAFLDAAIPPP